MYKKWSNLEGWKQMFFSTPPERLPVRCKFPNISWNSTRDVRFIDLKISILVLKEATSSSEIPSPAGSLKPLLKPGKSSPTNSDQSLLTRNEANEDSSNGLLNEFLTA